MAYEASEIMTAHALRYPSAYLKKITTYNQLTALIDESIAFHNDNKALNAGQIQFADDKTRTGFGSQLDYENLPSVAKQLLRVGDMAIGVSAAIAIRGYVGSPAGTITTYITGVKWPAAVSHFQVDAFGFKDYNSADIIVQVGVRRKINKFFGISLKKKQTVKSQDPTLINKAFDTAFVVKQKGNEEVFEKFKKLTEDLVTAREEYFANIVIDAVEGTRTSNGQPIIASKDIKGFQQLKTSNKKELYEAKQRDRTEFDRAYINTQGWATAPMGYKDNDFRNALSMRTYVNKRLADKADLQSIWAKFTEVMDEGADSLGNHLINIILKTNLYMELEESGLDDNDFSFALVTGIGNVSPKHAVNIVPGRVIPLKTTLCGLTRIKNKYKNSPYEVIQDVESTNSSNAAKIFFKLIKGPLTIMLVNIRYKGDFKSQPQFQAKMTQEFKRLLDQETCSGPG